MIEKCRTFFDYRIILQSFSFSYVNFFILSQLICIFAYGKIRICIFEKVRKYHDEEDMFVCIDFFNADIAFAWLRIRYGSICGRQYLFDFRHF